MAFQLITESQSLLKRSERVKRFIEVSPRECHRAVGAPNFCEAAKDDTTTHRGMHLALGADKLDLSSTYE